MKILPNKNNKIPWKKNTSTKWLLSFLAGNYSCWNRKVQCHVPGEEAGSANCNFKSGPAQPAAGRLKEREAEWVPGLQRQAGGARRSGAEKTVPRAAGNAPVSGRGSLCGSIFQALCPVKTESLRSWRQLRAFWCNSRHKTYSVQKGFWNSFEVIHIAYRSPIKYSVVVSSVFRVLHLPPQSISEHFPHLKRNPPPPRATPPGPKPPQPSLLSTDCLSRHFICTAPCGV